MPAKTTDAEFWIDVGGTFTDCFLRTADGALRRHKLLSSGVTKGIVGEGSTAARIVDPARRVDPPGFWTGFNVRLFDSAGQPAGVAKIIDCDLVTGTLIFDSALDAAPRAGQAYELWSSEEAPVLAIRYLLGLSLSVMIPPMVVRLGTTRGTNALLTRGGARTGLVTTRGFRDVLLIGYQNRPRLFDLAIQKPPPLFAAVVEIDERVTADGEVLLAPDPDQIRAQLTDLHSQGIVSLAVCLLHAVVNPEHEKRIEQIAREVGFRQISLSSDVAPLAKIVPRGDTTVVDAYLSPVLRDYVASLRRSLPGSDVRIVTSAGGLVAAEHFSGKDSILSGPAGGVVGFSRAAQTAGFERALGFDMGGTSTDVSRFDGRLEMQFETEKAGVRVVAPMLAIETVAAGGGSICRFDGVKLIVGPESAGADPGPACYGRGGPLCVTDLNLYLGKILPERFPFPLDRRPVETHLQALCDQIRTATGKSYEPLELAAGLVRIANANMVKAVRSISIAKGCDPADYVLVPFGGAAGQHACAVASELGIRRILCHPDAGLLSAYGIGLADHTRHRVTSVQQAYSAESLADLEASFARMAAEATAELIAEGVARNRIVVERSLDLRYRGIDAYLTIPALNRDLYQAAFERQHQQLYGYVHAGRPLEIVAARVAAIGRAEQSLPPSVRFPAQRPQAQRTTSAYFDGGMQSTQVFDRDQLQAGNEIIGPAIINEATSTTVIDPHWQAAVLSQGELLLEPSAVERQDDKIRSASSGTVTAADPIRLEIFNNQFAGIAEQMGITLRNTASSVNVKERLDFSCAIFTAGGDLVVNAPHIPVHLGAMGETVRRTIADNPDLQPGDVIVTNDPYRGGSHLPDVTVVTPVHEAVTERLLFFTACRAHHAEIGGIVPGSMPPQSRNLAEEGVLVRNFKLIAAGQPRFDALRSLLLGATFPTRAVNDNLADIAAQVAANQQGGRALLDLVRRETLPVVEAYMGHIQAAAEQKMRAALARLTPGRREFVDHLDDGSPIQVAVTTAGDTAVIDFTGTGPVLSGNLNANRAIVTAAVMYCLRCLIDEDIPLNQGVLAPIQLILPECLLNPPERDTPAECAAVVGGNVETSQRVVDVLLGALGLAAASQGTMNNLLFGDGTFGYYETICGGAGATPSAPGADAVHTHMTNTRLTDPEVLERRYPVRLLEFSIRRGSGGHGLNRGGDGVVRRLDFLRPLEVSLLSQRRGPFAPYGVVGGASGELGRNLLTRAAGSVQELPALTQFQVQAGDVLTIETPGGGAWGHLPTDDNIKTS